MFSKWLFNWTKSYNIDILLSSSNCSSAFLNFSPTDILGRIILYFRRLFRELQDVWQHPWQHPWPPPSRCQQCYFQLWQTYPQTLLNVPRRAKHLHHHPTQMKTTALVETDIFKIHSQSTTTPSNLMGSFCGVSASEFSTFVPQSHGGSEVTSTVVWHLHCEWIISGSPNKRDTTHIILSVSDQISIHLCKSLWLDRLVEKPRLTGGK